ncbi:hypothetical protein CBER1_07898 [Cercospora berteroae]|uniref:F-box domain-containing protein n=1 Tax=Cercospora berteroae TaxID=357750 RepID=A0A2S6BUG7_9PEZI|nr:hypothetical protein CBER1_07898 [Cercospora berteroae]
MTSHNQIEATQDIVQQLPGEVVAHIASEFAKRHLKVLNLKLPVTKEESFSSGLPCPLLDEEFSTTVELIGQNDLGGYVQRITFSEESDQDDFDIECRIRLRIFFLQLTSLRAISVKFQCVPAAKFFLSFLATVPKIPLTELNLYGASINSASQLMSVRRNFSASLNRVHFEGVRMPRKDWIRVFNYIRDGMNVNRLCLYKVQATEDKSDEMLLDSVLPDNEQIYVCDPAGKEWWHITKEFTILHGETGVKDGLGDVITLMERVS